MRLVLIALAACVAASGAGARARRIHTDIESTAPKTAPDTHAGVGNVDGGWSVEAATTVGQCAGLIPNWIEIAEGKFAAPGLQGEAWGYIDGEGQIVARFTTSDGRIARFHGNLRGGHGSGAWSSSTDMCGGTWRAARGGRESAQQ